MEGLEYLNHYLKLQVYKEEETVCPFNAASVVFDLTSNLVW